MGVLPADLIRLAKELHVQDSEAAWRAAASRAYYAAHHIADTACNRMGISRTERAYTRQHQKVIRALMSFPAQTTGDYVRGRAAGMLLQHCYDIRLLADYALNAGFSPGEAQEAIALAEQIAARV